MYYNSDDRKVTRVKLTLQFSGKSWIVGSTDKLFYLQFFGSSIVCKRFPGVSSFDVCSPQREPGNCHLNTFKPKLFKYFGRILPILPTKSSMQETLNLLTCANSSTNAQINPIPVKFYFIFIFFINRYVLYHMSCVICCLSCATCHLSCLLFHCPVIEVSTHVGLFQPFFVCWKIAFVTRTDPVNLVVKNGSGE